MPEMGLSGCFGSDLCTSGGYIVDFQGNCVAFRVVFCANFLTTPLFSDRSSVRRPPLGKPFL